MRALTLALIFGVGLSLLGNVPSAGAEDSASHTPNLFGYVEGMYALKSNGEGTFQDRSTPGRPDVEPDDGFGINGMIGLHLWDRWDIALAGGHVELGRGNHDNGGVSNNFGVEDADSWHLEGTIGYNPELGFSNVRLFTGVRYREWNHRFEFFPAAPAGCCGGKSEAWGVGPLFGFSGNIPLNETFGLFGGADVAILFGEMKATRNPGAAAVRTTNQTMVDFGARAGININLMDSVRIGAGYKVNLTTNATYRDHDLIGPPQSGHADRIIHGPFARISIDLPK